MSAAQTQSFMAGERARNMPDKVKDAAREVSAEMRATADDTGTGYCWGVVNQSTERPMSCTTCEESCTEMSNAMYDGSDIDLETTTEDAKEGGVPAKAESALEPRFIEQAETPPPNAGIFNDVRLSNLF
ncbi:hypothetical protein HDV00_010131 [Rhizophlyctis rosea]|nr:hypothetical protein HDV00_010131 [Rhizophlyctis rosea]